MNDKMKSEVTLAMVREKIEASLQMVLAALKKDGVELDTQAIQTLSHHLRMTFMDGAICAYREWTK